MLVIVTQCYFLLLVPSVMWFNSHIKVFHENQNLFTTNYTVMFIVEYWFSYFSRYHVANNWFTINTSLKNFAKTNNCYESQNMWSKYNINQANFSVLSHRLPKANFSESNKKLTSHNQKPFPKRGLNGTPSSPPSK